MRAHHGRQSRRVDELQLGEIEAHLGLDRAPAKRAFV
jgi:hypothetical protein